MFFRVSLYVALAIFGFGLIWKISNWFRYDVSVSAGRNTPSERVFAAVKGIALTVFSRKILTLLRVFFTDVLLQFRSLKESKLRWFMHMCLFYGFMSLLLLHGLDKFTTSAIFRDYSSTLNPFLFIRNLSLAIVVFGLALALYRRTHSKVRRLRTHWMDAYAIGILAVIMLSGVLLEATKIVSYSIYKSMVEAYADGEDEEELKALEAYWVNAFGVVSPNVKAPFDENILIRGKELHEVSCSACHSKPQWAPLSYGVSKMMKPVALSLDRVDVSTFLWYVHFLACFVGLAYLPFSKMFHIFASPLSLLANAVVDVENSDPANVATKQVMELDACTHCGTCSQQCSVGVTFEVLPNVNILPSEKMASIRALVSRKELSEKELLSLQEGLYLCTNCYRCTVVCPVGINLQDLWFNVREALLKRGHPELLALSPFSLYRGLKSNEIEEDDYKGSLQLAIKAIAEQCNSTYVQKNPIDLKQTDRAFKKALGTSIQGGSFSYCFRCMTCSNACPVVRNYDSPREVLGLLPHQIIHAVILGMPEMVYQSNMLWTCLGCYQCQESCPQDVRVTDVFYEIKNMAMSHVKREGSSL